MSLKKILESALKCPQVSSFGLQSPSNYENKYKVPEPEPVDILYHIYMHDMDLLSGSTHLV